MHPKDRIDAHALRTEFHKFKKSSDYGFRKSQFAFRSVANKILHLALQRSILSNEDLTALIQMFKWHCREHTFNDYLSSLRFPGAATAAFRRDFKRTMQDGQGSGFTSAPKAVIRGLTPTQLDAVRSLLIKIISAKSPIAVKDACDCFQDKSIPQVRPGIFSPWLHYLRPRDCPVTTGPGRSFLYTLGWSGRYSEAIEVFSHMAAVVGEPDFGFLDAFLWDKKIPRKLIRPDMPKERIRSGGGYQQNTELRIATENYAMRAAKQHYRENGFTVHDVSKSRPFDLLCKRKGSVVHVEVKGSTGDPGDVELTIGEVENARSSEWRTDLFVHFNIRIVKEKPLVLAGGRTSLHLGWRPSQKDLSPIRFRCRLPAPAK